MTPYLSKQDTADLARVEKYLILSLMAKIGIGLFSVFLLVSINSDLIFNVSILIQLVVGLIVLFFYFFLLKLARIPRPWLFIALAILLGSNVLGKTSLFVWFIIAYHVSQVNNSILKPKGYQIGILGPKARLQ